MRMLPNLTVIVPADYNQTVQATLAIAEWEGPVYLRFGRPSVPVFVPENATFQIGKAEVLTSGQDVSVIACGHLVWTAIEAQKVLRSEDISVEVINMHTIKPLDEAAVIASAQKTGCVVTAEEHMRNGGLGDAVAQVLMQHHPCPQEYVAVNDRFGESGPPMELMKKYGLGVEDIITAIKRAIKRKKL